LKKLLIKELV